MRSRRGRLLKQVAIGQLIVNRFRFLNILASFDFRAVSMPKRHYVSFRREGNALSRLCKKHDTSSLKAEVFWTLGFQNSSFGGEFTETLLQALRKCTAIRSLSFSREESAFTDDKDHYGSTLLAYLASSLPPWIHYLSFDNILSKRAINLWLDLMKAYASTSLKMKGRGTLRGLAIRNSPHLRALFEKLNSGGKSSKLLKRDV